MPKSTESQVTRLSSPLAHGESADDWQVAHAALAADSIVWSRLNWLGFQLGLSGLMEMRECPCCGSQLSRAVVRGDALDLLGQIMGVCQRTLDCVAASERADYAAHAQPGAKP